MKPVDSTTDLKHILEDRPLLLLNQRLFAVRYVKQLLALGTTSLSTKYALPTELWNMIFELALVHEQEIQDEFCWVQVVSSTKKLLHCREVDLYGKKCGEYTTTKEVNGLESFVNGRESPRTHESDGKQRIQQKGTFAMPLPSTGDAFLFFEIQVVDIIKHVEGGDCSLCENRRRWNTFFRYGKFGTLGTCIDVVCPLCIGFNHAQSQLYKSEEIRYYAARDEQRYLLGEEEYDEEEMFDEQNEWDSLEAQMEEIVTDCGYELLERWPGDY